MLATLATCKTAQAERGGLTTTGFLHRAPKGQRSGTILKRCARATLRKSFRFSRVVLARKQRTCAEVLGVLTLGCCEVLKGTLSTHSRGRKARKSVLVRSASEFRYSARMPVTDSVLQHAVLCCKMLYCCNMLHYGDAAARPAPDTLHECS